MAHRIMTLHPEGKQGVNIDRAKYDAVRSAIVQALTGQEALTFGQLTQAVGDALGASFDGSIGWYVTTVKLDLEARRVVERIPNRQPQTLRLVAGAD